MEIIQLVKTAHGLHFPIADNGIVFGCGKTLGYCPNLAPLRESLF